MKHLPSLPNTQSSVFTYLRDICTEQICANPFFRPVKAMQERNPCSQGRRRWCWPDLARVHSYQSIYIAIDQQIFVVCSHNFEIRLWTALIHSLSGNISVLSLQTLVFTHLLVHILTTLILFFLELSSTSRHRFPSVLCSVAQQFLGFWNFEHNFITCSASFGSLPPAVFLWLTPVRYSL